ncbi:hypothetical protein DSO57_1014618 [Entomophthora muscae]|uniref:Uncharacterized protein n=1 Tax=Entomophthora muscae TaxID=34485 RepID=A0ACC2URH2_9FUNG|nr:hypothetical protein DSO57_1014618 [Entomophthora muscae]
MLAQVERLCRNRHKPVGQDPGKNLVVCIGKTNGAPVFSCWVVPFFLKIMQIFTLLPPGNWHPSVRHQFKRLTISLASGACSKWYTSTGRLSGPGAFPLGASFRVALTFYSDLCHQVLLVFLTTLYDSRSCNISKSFSCMHVYCVQGVK